jgi:hypothetical protein
VKEKLGKPALGCRAAWAVLSSWWIPRTVPGKHKRRKGVCSLRLSNNDAPFFYGRKRIERKKEKRKILFGN